MRLKRNSAKLINNQSFAPSFSTLKYWTAEFKRGRTSVFDEERPGHTIEVTTPEIIENIHDIVINHWRVKVREIAKTVCILLNWCRIFFQHIWI